MLQYHSRNEGMHGVMALFAPVSLNGLQEQAGVVSVSLSPCMLLIFWCMWWPGMSTVPMASTAGQEAQRAALSRATYDLRPMKRKVRLVPQILHMWCPDNMACQRMQKLNGMV